jgi:hypothetical protein
MSGGILTLSVETRQKAEGRRQKAEGRKEKIDWSRFGAFCFVLIALATAIIQG